MNIKQLEPFWSGYKQKYHSVDYCEFTGIHLSITLWKYLFFFIVLIFHFTDMQYFQKLIWDMPEWGLILTPWFVGVKTSASHRRERELQCFNDRDCIQLQNETELLLQFSRE